MKCDFSQAAQPTAAPESTCNGVSFARWHVSEKDVVYDRIDVHTLSLYIKGGRNSYRTDVPQQRGGPGKVCFMPRGHQSNWAIRDDIDFFHLYIPQKSFDWFFMTTYEQDVREASLHDLLYESDEQLSAEIMQLVRIAQNSDMAKRFAMEQGIANIMNLMFTRHFANEGTENAYAGGLSPFHQRQVRDYLHSHYMCKLSLQVMAELTGLSVFHFAKMFKISFGISPSEFVSLLRTEKIKNLLRTNESLAQISIQAGFSHQSHMTQAFKSRTGKTPAQYRKMIVS